MEKDLLKWYINFYKPFGCTHVTLKKLILSALVKNFVHVVLNVVNDLNYHIQI